VVFSADSGMWFDPSNFEVGSHTSAKAGSGGTVIYNNGSIYWDEDGAETGKAGVLVATLSAGPAIKDATQYAAIFGG